MKALFALMLALTSFASISHAGTYEDRARVASDRAWDHQMGMVRQGISRDNRRQLALIRGFVARHGGAATEPVCNVAKMSCYDEGGGYTKCMGFGDHQSVALSAIDPDDLVSIGECTLDLNDGFACKANKPLQTTTVDCYDPQSRAHSYTLGK